MAKEAEGQECFIVILLDVAKPLQSDWSCMHAPAENANNLTLNLLLLRLSPLVTLHVVVQCDKESKRCLRFRAIDYKWGEETRELGFR